jgi:hypothetical protein
MRMQRDDMNFCNFFRDLFLYKSPYKNKFVSTVSYKKAPNHFKHVTFLQKRIPV